MSTSFWINDPSILINEKYILNFWPLENMSQNQKLNSISRLVIILTIIGTLITQSFRMAVTGIITLGVIVLLYFIQNKNKSKKEAFSSINLIKNNYVPPTESNPLMNVPLTDYKDNNGYETLKKTIGERLFDVNFLVFHSYFLHIHLSHHLLLSNAY